MNMASFGAVFVFHELVHPLVIEYVVLSKTWYYHTRCECSLDSGRPPGFSQSEHFLEPVRDFPFLE
jgi:hypothetical protein